MKIAAMKAGLPVAALTLGLLLLGTAPAAAQEGSDGLGEALNVHGHWIIEIYDGDELVERIEFENELVGSEVLARVLARDSTIGPWEVGVSAEVDEITCPLFLVYHDGGCFQSGTLVPATGSVPDTGEHAGDLVLQREVRKTDLASNYNFDGWRIVAVGTRVGLCDGSVSPTECAAREFSSLDDDIPRVTSRELTTAIDVLEDQRAEITVILSFQ